MALTQLTGRKRDRHEIASDDDDDDDNPFAVEEDEEDEDSEDEEEVQYVNEIRQAYREEALESQAQSPDASLAALESVAADIVEVDEEEEGGERSPMTARPPPPMKRRRLNEDVPNANG